MKKMIALLLALGLCVGMCGCGAKEEPVAPSTPAVRVLVTIADAGELKLSAAPVDVPDEDGDGACTVAQALAAAHDVYFDGGAEAGFAAEEGDYGLMLTKLWGVENGGSYGYYVNNAAAMSLEDTVAMDGYVAAYTYADAEGWSDMYTYFDTLTAETAADAELTFTLTGAGFDEAWAPIPVPVAGAELTLNGTPTGVFTDENGTATLTLSESGEAVVSAVSTETVLVPPVCLVTVK